MLYFYNIQNLNCYILMLFAPHKEAIFREDANIWYQVGRREIRVYFQKQEKIKTELGGGSLQTSKPWPHHHRLPDPLSCTLTKSLVAAWSQQTERWFEADSFFHWKHPTKELLNPLGVFCGEIPEPVLYLGCNTTKSCCKISQSQKTGHILFSVF